MKNLVLKYGVISGLISCVWLIFAIFISTGQMISWGMFFGFASMILAFAFIFVAVKQYRDKYCEGAIRFGKAYMIGFYIALIASTFYVVAWEIDFNFFMTDFYEKYTEVVVKQMRESGKPEAEITKTAQEMAETGVKYKNNPFYRIGLTYMEILPVGMLVSLIAAIVLKRKRKASDVIDHLQS